MKKLRKILESKIILLVVFVTGACVLVLEVIATRILSPYFGNTIFNYSSVIGVVLAALSLGYFLGGKFADKYPESKIFYGIILLSGFSTLILRILMIFILPLMGYRLPVTTGPVIASFVLFSIPCFLMGMLSPFAIKLQEMKFKKLGIGKLSGEVFFASTLGSIVGTFLSGFYLIPNFGIGNIVLGVSLTLFLIGLTGIFGPLKNRKNAFLIIFLFSLFFIVSLTKDFYTKKVIFVADGFYDRVVVLDSEFKGKNARLLVQDRGLSSGIDLEDKESLLFDYTKFIDLYKLFEFNPQNALFIGGGAYSMPSYLIKNLPDIEVDVAEVEPSLYSIAKKYFDATESPRLVNHIKDGRRFLYDTDKNYDIIFSDVYSSVFSVPTHFTTQEFFNLAKSKLTQRGFFLANIISDLAKYEVSLVHSEMKTFRSVFPNSYFFAVDSLELKGAQNVIFLGVNTSSKVDLAKASKIYPENNILKDLPDKLIKVSEESLEKYPILTDDYSPTEYLTSKLFI